MSSTGALATGTAAARVAAIDLYRGIALLLMIAAHVCDAFLDDRWRHGWTWYAFDITVGFVAPAFLFLSGLSLALSLRRKERSSREVLARLGTVLALAYWLQIPVLSLRQLIWERRPDELARLFDANILHVIAIGGAIVLALDRTLRSRAHARAVAATLAAAVVIATPYLWSSSLAGSLWLPLRALASAQPPATFPLTPYLAYLLLGYASLSLVPINREKGSSRRTATIAAAGATLVVAAWALELLVGATPPHSRFWYGSIQHTLLRLGGVAIGLALCVHATRRKAERPSTVARMGRRSLAVYVLHLVAIYGSPMTMGARYWSDGALNRALDPPAVLALFLVIAAATAAAALAWPRLRRRQPIVAMLLFWGWWGAFAALFLLTP